MMTVNLTNTDALVFKFLVSLESSTDSGTTWTLAQSAQTDVVAVGYCVNLNINAMANVPANSWWHVTIYEPSSRGLYVHFSPTCQSAWCIYRVG